MKLTAPSRAVLVGLAAAVALVAVWYQLLWTPQSAAIASARSKADASSGALISAQQRLGHLKRLSTKSVAFDAASAKLVAAIPDHDDMDNFLLALNTDAQTAGVQVTSIGLAQPVAATSLGGSVPTLAGVSPIPLQMSVSGGYFDIQRFLGLLRDGPRLVVIDTVSLSGAGASRPGGGTQVSGAIVGHVYMVKGVTPPGVDPPPTTVAHSGTGVLETPINAAKSAAAAASAHATASAGGTP